MVLKISDMSNPLKRFQICQTFKKNAFHVKIRCLIICFSKSVKRMKSESVVGYYFCTKMAFLDFIETWLLIEVEI